MSHDFFREDTKEEYISFAKSADFSHINLENTLGVLRKMGASKTESIFAIMIGCNLEYKDALYMVINSKTWADTLESSQKAFDAFFGLND